MMFNELRRWYPFLLCMGQQWQTVHGSVLFLEGARGACPLVIENIAPDNQVRFELWPENLSSTLQKAFLMLVTSFFAVFLSMRIHQLIGGSTGHGWSLQHFIWAITFSASQSNQTFIWDKCCHLTIWLHLMEPNWALDLLKVKNLGWPLTKGLAYWKTQTGSPPKIGHVSCAINFLTQMLILSFFQPIFSPFFFRFASVTYDLGYSTLGHKLNKGKFLLSPDLINHLSSSAKACVERNMFVVEVLGWKIIQACKYHFNVAACNWWWCLLYLNFRHKALRLAAILKNHSIQIILWIHTSKRHSQWWWVGEHCGFFLRSHTGARAKHTKY